MKLISGILIGLLLGSSLTVWAQIVTRTGFMIGWDVVIDGDIVCSDPYAWVATREIECD